jgi:hypothetical protein
MHKKKGIIITNLVHMIQSSLISSDHMRAVQSPTDKKFLGKNGFLCNE